MAGGYTAHESCGWASHGLSWPDKDKLYLQWDQYIFYVLPSPQSDNGDFYVLQLLSFFFFDPPMMIRESRGKTAKQDDAQI